MSGRGRWNSTVVVTAIVCMPLLAVSVWAWWPIRSWQPPPVQKNSSPPADSAPPSPRAALAEYDVIWQRDLAQPVVDPPPKANAPPVESAPPIALVGTAVAADERLGIFSLPNNSTVVKREGEIFQGFEVIAVERGRARLRRDGREFDLRVPWFDRIQLAENN